MKQRTLLREVSLKGKALHTGEEVNMTIKPAPENHGIVFQAGRHPCTPNYIGKEDGVHGEVPETSQ